MNPAPVLHSTVDDTTVQKSLELASIFSDIHCCPLLLTFSLNTEPDLMQESQICIHPVAFIFSPVLV